MTWSAETVLISQKNVSEKDKNTLCRGLFLEPVSRHIIGFLWFKNARELFLSSLDWYQRENSPCDICSMTRKKLQNPSTETYSCSGHRLLCTAGILHGLGKHVENLRLALLAPVSSYFPQRSSSHAVSFACSKTSKKQSKGSGFQWIQYYIPHLFYKFGKLCPKGLPVIYCLVLIPPDSNEMSPWMWWPQLSSSSYIHLHNALLTTALGRPVNQKSRAKSKKTVSFFPPGRISHGGSLRDSTAAIVIQRPLETTSLSMGFQKVSTRLLLQSVKNKTHRISQCHVSEKAQTVHCPQGQAAPRALPVCSWWH